MEKEIGYRHFKGFTLEKRNTIWRYSCASEVPIQAFICIKNPNFCHCGSKMALLVYQYVVNGKRGQKMHGKKCPMCGNNYFTEKTFSLCPKAYNILSDFDVSIEKKKSRSLCAKQKEGCSIPALQEEKEKKDSNKINEDNVRKLSLTEDKIKQICNRYNMKYNISVNIVFLTTSCGYWRVYVDGEKVTKVFHGNYRMKMNDRKKKKKCNEGFHQQKISSTKFEDVVRYIHYHDKKRYSNYKKTNVEILLDKISLEDLKNQVMKD